MAHRESDRDRCLVLGGCGFLGSVVTKRLVMRGWKVRVFDKHGVDDYRLKSVLSDVEFVTGDYMNLDDLANALEGVSTVLHFIGTTILQTSMSDIQYDIETNVLPTVRLLELMKNRGPMRLLFASSGGTVYGIAEHNRPLLESDRTEPIAAYGISKLATEKYIQVFSYNYDLRHVILRFANPYGKNQDPARRQGAVAVFLNKARHQEEIAIWGDGSTVRDYIYEEDVASAVESVMNEPALQGVLNVGTGVGTSLNEVVDLVGKTLSVPCRVRYDSSRMFDVPYNVLDIHKITAATGWKPTYTLEAGLQKLALPLKI